MKIVFENKRVVKESLSYGEIAAIQDEWEKFKKRTGRNDAGAAWEFIETECAGVYDTEEEQNEIFTEISALEESYLKESYDEDYEELRRCVECINDAFSDGDYEELAALARGLERLASIMK